MPDDPDARGRHYRCLEHLYVSANRNRHDKPHVHIEDGKARVRRCTPLHAERGAPGPEVGCP